ncbi:MAG: L-serine ammonia-lyase, iron-sulfur-dependent, subunit alpha [Clostridia bacterium]|nr:L-serine ammonia-lyase, iron-sulfur-dependent, subunit alpha [Clostridia bacterium]
MKSPDFAERIAHLRKEYNLTQSELGKQLGVTNRAVSKWENGISNPQIELIYKMCKMYGKDLDYFFEGTEVFVPDEEKKKKSMPTIREIYKIGRGPSSSHTMGPEKASLIFKERYPDCDRYKAVLYGSLARTGKGHMTDFSIIETMRPKKCEVEFDYTASDLPHPNTLDIIGYKNGMEVGRLKFLSVGGGQIKIEGEALKENENLYPHHSFEEIKKYCEENEILLWQYVERIEGKEIYDFVLSVWKQMQKTIKSGISKTGVIPGRLGVQKKANHLYNQHHIDETNETRENRMVASFAFAVGEENACGETIVTAPTCGASGVLPAVMYYYKKKRDFSDEDIVHALETAALIGNLVKTNASISGAECGCQAEIGTACAMASAALAELLGMSLSQIEYAAEIAIEHHLGLTCDPIYGLVQIPCIERNAVAAMRAINAVNLANFLTDTRKISFDLVVDTMYETGKDLSKHYKETAEGGLSKLYK